MSRNLSVNFDQKNTGISVEKEQKFSFFSTEISVPKIDRVAAKNITIDMQ